MKVIKFKTGVSEIFPIEKNQFENLTKMKPPYYPDGENTMYPLAVCPHCDNPVQIIGFYKEIKRNPFGKHCTDTVKNLATYVESQYLTCPYKDPRRNIPSDSLANELTPNMIEVRNTLRDYFDQVVYYAGQLTGTYISDKESEDRLQIFVNGQRWLYPWITINNLPWIFVYLSWSKSLYGKLIRKSSPLEQSLLKYKKANLEDFNKNYSKLMKKGTKYFEPCYCFMQHKRNVVDDELNETFLFRNGFNTPPLGAKN